MRILLLVALTHWRVAVAGLLTSVGVMAVLEAFGMNVRNQLWEPIGVFGVVKINEPRGVACDRSRV
jgi:hypothetical protein